MAFLPGHLWTAGVFFLFGGGGGVRLGRPENNVYSILGSTLGSPFLGNLPHRVQMSGFRFSIMFSHVVIGFIWGCHSDPLPMSGFRF